MKKENKAVIYCRVSTTKQGNDGDSLKNQEKVCRAYCKANNMQVLGVFKEVFTGKQKSRPIFDEAISNAIENKVSHFIIFDIDRFSREGYSVYSELKNRLESKSILLRDSKNIIGETNTVIKNDKIDMGQYEWNTESRTEYAEIMMSTQAKIEGKKILQRTIPKEIQLEQDGYHVRESNFGYINSKIRTDGGKKNIQVKHPIEGDWIIEMFKLRAENKLSDEEIVKEINLLGYKSRLQKKLNVKQLQVYIKKPIYAGIIVSKWTGYNPIRTAYNGLVGISLWNKANRGKQRIEVNKEGNINIVVGNTNSNEVLKKRRSKFDSRLKFRNLVKSSLIEDKLISGSFSNPKRSKSTGYYHTVRKKGLVGENIAKEEYESNIYSFVEDLEINAVLKEIFIDRFEAIFESNKHRIESKLQDLEKQASIIDKDIEKIENNISSIDTSLTRVLNSIEKQLTALEYKKEQIDFKIESYKKANFSNLEQFKEFSFYLIEHMAEIMSQSQNLEELQLLFKFIFKETPSYNDIVNRTCEVYPIFALQSKKEPSNIESSSVNLNWQAY